MAGAANEMQTRSMYVITASVTAKTMTQYRTRVAGSVEGCGRGTIRIVCHTCGEVRGKHGENTGANFRVRASAPQQSLDASKGRRDVRGVPGLREAPRLRPG